MKKSIIAFICCIALFPTKCMANIAVPDSALTDSVKWKLTLNEVIIKSERIMRKSDGYVVNLIGSEMTKGKDMYHLLTSLPGMTLEEGVIKIHGQAPAAVYLNGTPSSIDIIKTLPPDRIASIEINWDAGSQERTGAHGGIIRIKTKRELGINGTINGTVQWLRENNGNMESINPFISLGTKRLTIYNSLTMYNSDINGRYTEKRTMADSHTSLINEKTNMRGKMVQDWLNLSYDLAQAHQLSLSGMLNYYDGTDNNITATTSNIDGSRNSDYQTPVHLLLSQAIAMYNWNIDSLGSYFRVTADYLRRNNNQKQTITSKAVGQETNVSVTSTRQTADMIRIKPMWYKEIRDYGQLSAGLDLRYIHYDNANIGPLIRVNTKMTAYTPAAYATYYGRIGNSLSYSFGLRFQYDDMTVRLNDDTNNNERTVNTYKKYSLTPSLSVNYDICKKCGHSLYFTYSHYVGEMPYDAISTFRKYDEANHYTIGNQNINPKSEHYAGITLTMFRNYSLDVSYSYYKNIIYYTNDVDPDNHNILRSMAKNTNNGSFFSIGFEQKITPLQWWTLKANERFSLYSGLTPDWEYSNQPHWTFLINNDFKFGKSWGGNLYSYIDPSCNVQDQWWNTVIDITCNIYKTFFNDKLTVSLDAKPYRKGREKKTYNTFYRSVRTNKTKEEYIGLTITYSFNAGKVKNRRAAQSIQNYNTISRPSM